MSTGFTEARARPHEHAVQRLLDELFRRGYAVFEQPLDGHRPDARLASGEYVEVKTGTPNLAIELASLQTYRQIETLENTRVYIVWIPDGFESPPADWVVATLDSLTAGILHGPHRHSGSGSNDDWYLCRPRGVPFITFFQDVSA
jgi:hypothetical protein